MKKIMCILLSLITLAPAAACARPVEPDLSAYDASGRAEIPVEILGELDEELREDLLEAPKYVALTFDDGPRADTTERLLDGLRERGILVRWWNRPDIRDWLRISIGTDEEMDALIQALCEMVS